MNIDFAALAREKTEDELEAMLARPADWDARAIEAARAELARRGGVIPESEAPGDATAPARDRRTVAERLAMAFGALLIGLALVVLVVAGPSIAVVAPAVSGAALLFYFGTRKH